MRLRLGLAVTLSATTLPLVIIMVVSLLSWYSAEETSAEDRALTRAHELALQFQGLVDECRRVLVAEARSPQGPWTHGAERFDQLDRFSGLFPFAHGVFWFDPEGRLISPANPDVSVSDRSWFQTAVQARDFVVGQFIVSRTSNAPSLPLAYPVVRDGHVIGVLAMSIDLDWFYGQVVPKDLSAGVTLAVVDPNSMILAAYPHPERSVGQKFPKWDQRPGTQRAAESHPGRDGAPRLYARQPIVSHGVLLADVLVGIPLSQIHVGSLSTQKTVWATLGLVLVVGVGSVVYGMRALVLRPIMGLVEQTRALARGEFAPTLPVVRLPEELMTLAREINLLGDSLRRREDQVLTYQKGLESAVAERTKELVTSQAELERSNHELQQFAYVASHDLQEPLRMVASFTQLLARHLDKNLDPQAREYMNYAIDGATRMQRLINDLLEYSRIQSQEGSWQTVRINEILALVRRDLSVVMEERQAKLIVADDLPPVLGDPVRLEQLLLNLVANGFKFNRSPSPTVTVSARTTDSLVRFQVTDNGIGMNPEFRERAFVIFQRFQPRGEYPGTGIGLAVCQRIVQRHGGTIGFEPEPSGGTTFWFTLKPALGS